MWFFSELFLFGVPSFVLLMSLCLGLGLGLGGKCVMLGVRCELH